MHKTPILKRIIGILLAASTAVTAMPDTRAYAANLPEEKILPAPAEIAPEPVLPEEEEEPRPILRLVKKGEPSPSGYQEMVWVDENGNEVKEDTGLKSGNAARRTRTALPSQYSMKDLNLLPSVRNQGQWGTCWAHAALSSVETNMIKKGCARTDADYSERHLAYFAHRRDALLKDGTDTYDTTYGWYGAGNRYQAAAALANWYGAASEAEYPYSISGPNDTLAENARTASVSHLTDASFLSTPEDVKKAIMEHGAVMCSFHTGDGSSPSTAINVYNATDRNTDHAVTIVGWDDNYAKTNFNDKGSVPAGNGAWLCRNSWGAGWGNSGYFWISYEDKTISYFTSFEAEPINNYDRIYSYDGSVIYQWVGYSKSANIFSAQSDETLCAASLYAQGSYNYQIDIYVQNGASMNVPSDGLRVHTQSGSLEYPGYHVIPLDTPIPLQQGMKFAISVTFTAKAGESVYTALESGDSYSSQAGQSFFWNGSQWKDTSSIQAYYKNVPIKAFTRTGIDSSRPDLEAELEEADALTESDYPPEAWQRYREAYTSSYAVFQNENASKDDLLNAYLRLKAARFVLLSSVIVIRTAEDLENLAGHIRDNGGYAGKWIRLANDLDMAGVSHQRIGIYADNLKFQGTFDGQGHTISNLVYNSADDCGGLFGAIGAEGIVKNITLSDADFTLGRFSGFLAGSNEGTIENCHARGVLRGLGQSTGGIAGQNKGTISGCTVQGDFTFSESCAGGICGYNPDSQGTIRNCTAQGTFSFTKKTSGGICGYSNGIIEQCSVSGTLAFQDQTSNSYVGGIVGDNRGSIKKCSVSGTLTFREQPSSSSVGGIAGWNAGSILQSFVQGELISDGLAETGGIVGYSQTLSRISGCYNLAAISGSPSGSAPTAGIGACLYGTTSGCYNYGSIRRQAGNVFGAIFCYKNSGAVSNCYYLDTSCARGFYSGSGASVTSMTAAEFASGKTAYYLNSNGGTSANTYEWSQENGLPVFAEAGKNAIIKVSVTQDDANTDAVPFNGITNGAFYAIGETEIEHTWPQDVPGYDTSRQLSGLSCINTEQTRYRLPKTDAEVLIRYRRTAKTYRITYHSNFETATPSGTYTAAASVTLPVPTRRKFEFLGWYDNAACSGTAIREIAQGSIGNKEFWAKWKHLGYEVIFPQKRGYVPTAAAGNTNGSIAEGGSFQFSIRAQDGYDVSNLSVKYGSTVLVPANGMYRIDNIQSDVTNLSIEGIRLGQGHYAVKTYNGYVGKTAMIAPKAPASGIKLANDVSFASGITADTTNAVSIVTCDEEGTVSDAETITFLRDTAAPVISSVSVQPNDTEEPLRDVCLIVDASDAQSGIRDYSFDGGQTWQAENRFLVSCGASETSFGSVIRVRDYVGNEAEYTDAITIPASGVAAEKTNLEITGIQSASQTYDGRPWAGYLGTPDSAYKGTYDIFYSGRGTTVYGSTAAPQNAGSYSVTIQIPENHADYAGRRVLDFEIRKANLTIQIKDKTAQTGSPVPGLTDSDYAINGIAEGETLTSLPRLYYASEPDMTRAGSVLIKADGAQVPDTGNYNETIRYVDGILHITPKNTATAIQTVASETITVSAAAQYTPQQLKNLIRLTQANVATSEGFSVTLPVTWHTNDAYDIKGKTYTYIGTISGNEAVDVPEGMTLAAVISVLPVTLENPVFEETQAEIKTNAQDVFSLPGILPASGMIVANGAEISYQIAWDAQWIEKTDSIAEFTGTISYENVPEWMTLPQSFAVRRSVVLKKTPDTPEPDPDDPNPEPDNSDPAPGNPKPSAPVTPNPDPNVTKPPVPTPPTPQDVPLFLFYVSGGATMLFEFDPSGNTVSLASFSYKTIKTLTSFSIPPDVSAQDKTYKITKINDGAFKNALKLKKIVIGENITTIGKQAFYNCKRLTQIEFKGNQIKTINAAAFQKTPARITIIAKKMTKQQKAALLKKMRKAGLNKKITIK